MLKMKRNTAKRVESPAKGTNPRVPHLDLSLELGSEDRHATPRIQLGSHPSCLC